MPKAQTPVEAPEVPEDVMVVPSTPTGVSTDGAGSRTPFQMPGSDEVLWAVRPKNVNLMWLGATVDAVLDPGVTPAQKLAGYRSFIIAALSSDELPPEDGAEPDEDAPPGPSSQDRIWERLSDPNDTLDEPDMDALLRTLMARWTERPTRQRSGRQPLPRTTGRPSMGRARSKE